MAEYKRSLIVELWLKIFSLLRWISPFQIVRKLIPSSIDIYFVEGWVLGNFLLSIVSYFILFMWSDPNVYWWETIAICWGAIRVFEVTIYQINVLLFDWYRASKEGKPYAVRGFLRLIILLLHNYVEIIFWFALFYRNMNWAFETGGLALDSFLVSLNFSFVTMTTFGHSNVFPKTDVGYILTLIQSAIGLFMALLILARFISLIPSPKTSDRVEKQYTDA